MVQLSSESASSQLPLKHFRLLAQDMMEHSSAAAVTVSNTAYWNDCFILLTARTTQKTVDLNFWVTNAKPLLAALAQVLLSAPASEAYVERCILSLWTADSRQEKSAGQKRGKYNIVVTSDIVFYFHALMQILCKITNWNRNRNWKTIAEITLLTWACCVRHCFNMIVTDVCHCLKIRMVISKMSITIVLLSLLTLN